ALPGDQLPEDIVAIIRDELNVKRVTFGAPEARLDTEITEPLKLEGLAREVVRVIQDRRKRLGFNVEDRIDTRYDADGLLVRAIQRHADYIKAETLSVTLAPGRDRPSRLRLQELRQRVDVRGAGADHGRHRRQRL